MLPISWLQYPGCKLSNEGRRKSLGKGDDGSDSVKYDNHMRRN